MALGKLIKSLVEGGWADKPHICWSQSGFLTGTVADRHWGPVCCALGVCVVTGSGTDTNIGFNTCGLITSSIQAEVGYGAGERGRW